MTNPEGPWSRLTPPPPPPKLRRRPPLWLWLGLIAVMAAGLYGLAQLFPGRVTSGPDQADVLRGVLLIALVGAGLMTRGLKLRQVIRDIAIWTAVILGAALLYSFRGEIGGAALRLRSELIPSYAVASAGQDLVVSRDTDGGFYVTGQVNGQPVRFLADTGSSDIVLSPADARRLGLDPAAMQFSKSAETANGIGFGAPYRAGSLAIGPIQLTDVPMSVNKAAMSSSLLGMTFFNRLQSFRIEGDKLYLKPRPSPAAAPPP